MKKPLDWRAGTLVFLLGAAGAVILSSAATLALARGQLGPGTGEAALRGWIEGHPLFAALLLWLGLLPWTWIFARKVALLSRERIGLSGAGGRKLLLFGLLGGLALLLIPALAARLAGGYAPVSPAALRAITVPSGAAALSSITFALPILLIAAFGEELLIRGLLLRYWERGLGRRGALVATSLLFVALHGQNAGMSALGGLGVFLAGLMLGVAMLSTGSLWFCTGLHLGWNCAVALVLGLPVSGYHLPALLRWRVQDSELARGLLGGDFGPEEGLLFHGALTVAIGLLLLARAAPTALKPKG